MLKSNKSYNGYYIGTTGDYGEIILFENMKGDIIRYNCESVKYIKNNNRQKIKIYCDNKIKIGENQKEKDNANWSKSQIGTSENNHKIFTSGSKIHNFSFSMVKYSGELYEDYEGNSLNILNLNSEVARCILSNLFIGVYFNLFYSYYENMDYNPPSLYIGPSLKYFLFNNSFKPYLGTSYIIHLQSDKKFNENRKHLSFGFLNVISEDVGFFIEYKISDVITSFEILDEQVKMNGTEKGIISGFTLFKL